MQDFIHQKAFLTPDEQRMIVMQTSQISPGFYVPRTRWGKPMSIRMNCLGRHWSALDYKYHDVRKDVDGLPCAPLPAPLQSLAQRAVIKSGYLPATEVRQYDACIVNLYGEAGSKLGDHSDNSESPAALACGYPVVSFSVGASCVFRMGGLRRTDPYEKYILDSGDLVIFGRSRRLAFHGVSRILPGTTPGGVGLTEPGRLNLTFRIT